MAPGASEAAERLRNALRAASHGLVDREWLLELVALAAVAREHVLVIGPPGTAKSEAARRVAAALGGRTFEYLLGRFTEPSELFGPVDLARLREGVIETRTDGMLPEADVAFLDEVFLGSTAILNTLLGILAERRFRRGHTQLPVPLRVCVAASNALPDDPALSAFADRFLLCAFVHPVEDALLEDLLEQGWAGRPEAAIHATMDDLDQLTALSRTMDPAPVREALATCVRRLRSAGVALSDRRVVKLQRLVTAAAALAGRTAPTSADLWPIIFAVNDETAQELARDALREHLDASENTTLPAAAEMASASLAARALRIAERATTLFATEPTEAAARATWLLSVEGLAREIDATFDEPPEALEPIRDRIVELLAGG